MILHLLNANEYEPADVGKRPMLLCQAAFACLHRLHSQQPPNHRVFARIRLVHEVVDDPETEDKQSLFRPFPGLGEAKATL